MPETLPQQRYAVSRQCIYCRLTTPLTLTIRAGSAMLAEWVIVQRFEDPDDRYPRCAGRGLRWIAQVAR